MRAALLAFACTLSGGCGDQRTFDERYDDTSRELENKARQLDENLAAESALNNTAEETETGQ
jgi:hypothetical protein